MRRYLLASALLALAACQPAGTDTPVETAPAAVATPGDEAPTEEEVQAAIDGSAAIDFVRKPLARALPDGIQIPVAYHRLFENRKDGDAGSEYRALMETFEPAEVVEPALDAEFTRRGFAVMDKSDAGKVRTLVYERTYGPSVTIRLSPYAPGIKAKAPNATGTLHLTWVTPK